MDRHHQQPPPSHTGVPSLPPLPTGVPSLPPPLPTGVPSLPPPLPTGVPSLPPPLPSSTTPLPITPYQHLLQQQQQELQMFWTRQRQDIEQVHEFKNQKIPLARIKKIMKADEDVHMVSAEAPILFAKACELFTMELTIRSWHHAQEKKRRTLQKNDIAAVIATTGIFDFLVDIVPREEIKDECGILNDQQLMMDLTASGVPPYYPPGAMMGMPTIDKNMMGLAASGVPPYYPPGVMTGMRATDQSMMGPTASGVPPYHPPGVMMGSTASGVPPYHQPGVMMGTPAIDESMMGSTASGVPPYHPPGVMMGMPATDESMYVQPEPLQAWQDGGTYGSGGGEGGSGNQGRVDGQG